MTDLTTALIYLRSAAQNDDAISRQRRACLDHAAAQDWVVIDVLTDNGASCFHDRDGFNTLRERVKAGQADVVLTQDPIRLSRDPDGLADFLRLCEDHKVRVAFTTGVVIQDWKLWSCGDAADTARLLAARRKRQMR